MIDIDENVEIRDEYVGNEKKKETEEQREANERMGARIFVAGKAATIRPLDVLVSGAHLSLIPFTYISISPIG